MMLPEPSFIVGEFSISFVAVTSEGLRGTYRNSQVEICPVPLGVREHIQAYQREGLHRF